MNLNLSKKQLYLILGLVSLVLSVILIYMLATNAAKPVKTISDPLTTCLNSKVGSKAPINNPFSNYVIFECYQKQSRFALSTSRITSIDTLINNSSGNSAYPEKDEMIYDHSLLTAGDLAFLGTYPDGYAGRNLKPVRIGASIGNREVVMENPSTGVIEKISLDSNYPGSSFPYSSYMMFGRDMDQVHKFSAPVTLTPTTNSKYVKFIKKFLGNYGEGDLSCPNSTVYSNSIYQTGPIDTDTGTYNENLKTAIINFKSLTGIPVITSTGFNYDIDTTTWQRIEQVILNEIIGMG
jgi:hypothetical protein